MLCLLSSTINIDNKNVPCLYYELTADTRTANYATCSIIALLYGENLGVKQVYIRVGVTNIVEDFWNADSGCYNL